MHPLEYTCCTSCVLDTTDTTIFFNNEGVCNYCIAYKAKEQGSFMRTQHESSLGQVVAAIKAKGRDSRYDCIIGVSGGLDSSYLLYLARKEGLRPLAVHYDSGWNTERAVRNIEKLVSALKTDLYTYVVDWHEFRDVQLAYLKAGVLDLEIPTDHSFFAALYRVAAKFDITYILSGHNFVTEGVMPNSWVYDKGDAANIKDIHGKHGTVALKSFPLIGLTEKFYHYNIRRIKNVRLLDHVPYRKADAIKVLAQNTGWENHPVKHGESVWTRFYQCYILPRRFGIDKRRAHLSNLICSGQITRAQAMAELSQPVYEESLCRADRDFILKKFELTERELEALMQMPKRAHKEYRTDAIVKQVYNYLRGIVPLGRTMQVSNQW